MAKFRMQRKGKKFNAFYQIVVADERAPRDGRFIERIGHYNPHSKELVINTEARDKWRKCGVKPSDTVKTLFKKYDAQNGITTSEVATKSKQSKTVISKVDETKKA